MNSLLFSITFFLALGFGQLADSQYNEKLLTSGSLTTAQLGQVCGIPAVSQSRISGGTDAKSGVWPWMAALYVYFPDIVNICGGTLINNRYVLTAAHCLYQRPSLLMTKKVIAILGNRDKLGKNDPNAKKYTSTTFITHNSYQPQYHLVFDIALINLETDIVFSQWILPACLPQSPDLANSDYMNKAAVVIGWGVLKEGGNVSTKLQQVNVKVIPLSTCTTAYGTLSKFSICAGDTTSGKGSCRGDSGGPLMLRDANNQENVIGIVSFGRECGNPKDPAVYTRVASFLDWIKENAGMK